MPIDQPHIVIVMCTFNGAPYLQAQLDSFLRQSHTNWSLWVSDDGSVDGTWQILQTYKRKHKHIHDIRLLHGPGRGACNNFLSVLCHPEFGSNYVALCDQDDVWLSGKLARAVSQLRKSPAGPVLYGAQSFHSDPNLSVSGRSNVSAGRPHFKNALVQNIVSGHSAVLSPDALNLVRDFGVPNGVPFHDWWLYQVVTGGGGHVILDTRPVLHYRQHEQNLFGAPRGPAAFAKRMKLLKTRQYKSWVRANAMALWARRHYLTPQAQTTVQRFLDTSGQVGPARAMTLWRLGLKRQVFASTAGLYVAGALGWV